MLSIGYMVNKNVSHDTSILGKHFSAYNSTYPADIKWLITDQSVYLLCNCDVAAWWFFAGMIQITFGSTLVD